MGERENRGRRNWRFWRARDASPNEPQPANDAPSKPDPDLYDADDVARLLGYDSISDDERAYITKGIEKAKQDPAFMAAVRKRQETKRVRRISNEMDPDRKP